MHNRRWLMYALATTFFWGVWGALIELPEKAGFPATLGYSVWALTMVPCSLGALAMAGWRLESGVRKSLLGLTVGLLGAGGQLLLFEALRFGPAYLVFPLVSLYPALAVLLAFTLLKERARKRAWAGVLLAFPAMFLMAYQPAGAGDGTRLAQWLPLTIGVFVAWGLQAYVMKVSTGIMSEESVFFYMMAGAVALIPVALWMTGSWHSVNWGFRGPGLSALIQMLNSIGALALVFAMRYGKAIIVVPMTSLAPLLTVVLSLAIYRVAPNPVVAGGMAGAMGAIYLMAE